MVLTSTASWRAQVLTGRARVEAEDAQRVLLAALNGLAGLMLLAGDAALAVGTYRQARRCARRAPGAGGRARACAARVHHGRSVSPSARRVTRSLSLPQQAATGVYSTIQGIGLAPK